MWGFFRLGRRLRLGRRCSCGRRSSWTSFSCGGGCGRSCCRRFMSFCGLCGAGGRLCFRCSSCFTCTRGFRASCGTSFGTFSAGSCSLSRSGGGWACFRGNGMSRRRTLSRTRCTGGLFTGWWSVCRSCRLFRACFGGGNGTSRHGGVRGTRCVSRTSWFGSGTLARFTGLFCTRFTIRATCLRWRCLTTFRSGWFCRAETTWSAPFTGLRGSRSCCGTRLSGRTTLRSGTTFGMGGGMGGCWGL